MRCDEAAALNYPLPDTMSQFHRDRARAVIDVAGYAKLANHVQADLIGRQ